MLFTPLEFFKICMIDAGKQYDIQWQDVLVYIDVIDIYTTHILYSVKIFFRNEGKIDISIYTIQYI